MPAPCKTTATTNAAAELPWREAISPLRGGGDETGGAMTEASEPGADSTRQRLIAAAARQIARRSYSMVRLGHILTEAEFTKAAMYFRMPCRS